MSSEEGATTVDSPLVVGSWQPLRFDVAFTPFPPQSQQRQRCERELKTGAVPRPPDFRLWFDLQPLAPANRALNLKTTLGVLGASPNLINRRGGQHMEATLARRWCREAGRELKGVSAVRETEDVGEGAVRSSKQRKVAEDFLEQEW